MFIWVAKLKYSISICIYPSELSSDLAFTSVILGKFTIQNLGLSQLDRDKIIFAIPELQNSSNCYAVLNKSYLGPPSPILSPMRSRTSQPNLSFGQNSQQEETLIISKYNITFLLNFYSLVTSTITALYHN